METILIKWQNKRMNMGAYIKPIFKLFKHTMIIFSV